MQILQDPIAWPARYDWFLDYITQSFQYMVCSECFTTLVNWKNTTVFCVTRDQAQQPCLVSSSNIYVSNVYYHVL